MSSHGNQTSSSSKIPSPTAQRVSRRSVSQRSSVSRRSVLRAGAAALAFPFVWIPNPVYAQQCNGRGGVKHLLYVRLDGGFRFTAAFNGDVADQFNPFGLARDSASGTEWGPSRLLEADTWLTGENGQALADLGMRRVPRFTNEIAVLATVDHEPFSGSADGNHGTGLERYLTGTVGGQNSLFTMLNYGIRERIAAASAEGRIELPPFVFGSSGMARGLGAYAAYRPPLIQGDSFDAFRFSGRDDLPAWASKMAQDADSNVRNRLMIPSRSMVDAYMEARLATQRYAEIFNSDVLKINNDSDDAIDGISNRQLATMFGDSSEGRRLRLALRLFSFGCPAVFLDQGAYDLHSEEDDRLPGMISGVNRMLSALHAALKRMNHPSGGKYWDHTLVVLGSEFGRTARGSRFNSAGGSDHGGDRATRWMSMPLMGGFVTQNGMGGKKYGHTAKGDLKDDGLVFSYRSMWKTMMDLLCADHSEFFTADAPITGIF